MQHLNTHCCIPTNSTSNFHGFERRGVQPGHFKSSLVVQLFSAPNSSRKYFVPDPTRSTVPRGSSQLSTVARFRLGFNFIHFIWRRKNRHWDSFTRQAKPLGSFSLSFQLAIPLLPPSLLFRHTESCFCAAGQPGQSALGSFKARTPTHNTQACSPTAIGASAALVPSPSLCAHVSVRVCARGRP